ncbi:MAG: hypothetical protein JO089_01615, partial [Alphaproteobacteria bacterium]|nr:hypothetical protein [Alphaproteobacteria bacterium]
MTKSRKPHAEDIAALNEQKISYGTALKSVLDKYGITVDELAKELRNSRINFKKIVDSYEKNKRHYAKGWKKLGKPQFEAMIQQLGALTPNAIQQILEGSYDFTPILKTFHSGEIIHYYPTEQYLPNLLTPADTKPTKKPSSFWRAMDAVLLITVFRLAVAHSEGQEEAE